MLQSGAKYTAFAGLSPGFSSRGAKNQKGGHIFKILYWMHAATRGPNVKCGGTDFKWGERAPVVPPLATALSICSMPELPEKNFCDCLEMKYTSPLGWIQQAGAPETAAEKRFSLFYFRLVITSGYTLASEKGAFGNLTFSYQLFCKKRLFFSVECLKLKSSHL